MSLEEEKTLICPENKLDCTLPELELLISQLPASKACKIKDIERTDEGVTISFFGENNIKFDIFWEARTKSCFAFPVDVVQPFIEVAKKSHEMGLTGNLNKAKRDAIEAVQELTTWYRIQLIAFINETGETPDSIEVGFENGGSVTRIERQTHDLVELILKNRASEPVSLSIPEAQPQLQSQPQPQLQPEPKSDPSEKEPELLFDFRPEIAFAALKLMNRIKTKAELARETGISYPSLNNYINGKAKSVHRPTAIKLQTWLMNNKEELCKLLEDQNVLTASDATILDEFFEDN